MRTSELMLYKNMDFGEILNDMTFLMENFRSEYYNKEDLRSLLFECVNRLLELSVSHGFEGNLWHTYLTFLLANHENAYSTSCEIVGEIQGTINEAALHDHGRVFQKRAPGAGIAPYRFVKGDHGNAVFVVLFRTEPAQKFGGLAPDERQVVPDQVLRLPRIVPGRHDPPGNPMPLFHTPPPLQL